MHPQNEEFRVVYHARARLQVNIAFLELFQAGWSKPEIEALLIALEERLKKDPVEFGEPIYTVRGTNILVCIGFVRPLSIEFGIDRDKRAVSVRKLILMDRKES